MVGSFITRGLVLIFGYAFPAYECYKSVEMNKPDIEQLLFWCQYWILVAMLTFCERIGDMFIGWIPLYGEAKLAFFIYLWSSRTKGTTYVYHSFFRPYVAKHEPEIDRSLLELRTRAVDMAFLYFQRAASYAQNGIFDILHYIASQSASSRKVQRESQNTNVQKSTAPSNSAPTAVPRPVDEPTSSTSSACELQESTTEETRPSDDTNVVPPTAATEEQKITSLQPVAESSTILNSTNEQAMQIVSVPPPSNEAAQCAPEDTGVQRAGRVTRARTRRGRTKSDGKL